MRDHQGRLVGRGTAPPIMITDDHKSSTKKGGEDEDDIEEPSPSQVKRKRKLPPKKDSISGSAPVNGWSQDDSMMVDGGEDAVNDQSGEEDEEEEEDLHQQARSAKRRLTKGGMTSAAPSVPGSAANSRPGTSMGSRKMNGNSYSAGSQNVSKSNYGTGYNSHRSSRRGTPSRRSSPTASGLTSRASTTTLSMTAPPTAYPSPEASLSPSQPQFNFSLPSHQSSVMTSPTTLSPMSMSLNYPMSITSPMEHFGNTNGSGLLQDNQIPDQSDIALVLATLDAYATAPQNPVAANSTQQFPDTNTQPGNSSSNSSSAELSPILSFPPLSLPSYAPSQAQTSPATSMASSSSPCINPHQLPPVTPSTLPLPQSMSNNMLGPSAFDASSLFPDATLGSMFHTSNTNGSTVPGMVMPSTSTLPNVPPPVIHRLIPSSGPMHGGIEVTILGANFLPTHECVFGGSIATSTQMWSENTIVCILPPSPSPGPVVVGFKGVPINDSNGGGGNMGGLLGLDNIMGMNIGSGLQLFTYLDNTDRAL